MAHAFTVFGVLAGRDVHAVLVEDWRGVDLAWALGGWVLKRLAVLVGFVLGRVEIGPEHFFEVGRILFLFAVQHGAREHGDDLGAVALLGFGVQRVKHPVAAAEEHQILVAHLSGRGGGPLAMEDARSDAGIVFGDQLAGLGIERDEAR